MFGVPRSTIQFHLSDMFSRSELGRPTILTKEEEEEIVEWILICASKGFPRRKLDIASSIAGFLQLDGRANPFSGGIPGKSWFKGFLKDIHSCLEEHQNLLLQLVLVSARMICSSGLTKLKPI